jgi:hypothetical protein
MNDPQQKLAIFHELTQSAIYMMGASFVLGSAFTLLLLVILDWMRSRNPEKETD